jgi:tRNA threonylcarbamoyladenosine biosynthesis protein TsaB
LKVVGIETSGTIGSVAVCEGSRCLEERSFEKGMRHGQALLPSIDEIFKRLGWQPGDIDLIAVSHGPGSFTGLRIGITCAKTLAYVLGKPLVAVPTLDVLAENVTDRGIATCPILDAKREAVYACIYKSTNGVWKRQTDFMAIEPTKLIPLLPRPVLIFGDGVNPYKELFIREGIIIGDSALGIARAKVVARLGIKLYEGGQTSDPFQLQPLYLRRPEAEERWEILKRD